MYKTALRSVIFSVVAMVAIANTNTVYADCEPNYGGGTCVYNKNFKIDKKVRFKGDDTWKDKITGVEEGDEIEFRIEVKNTGELDVDDMRYKDSLPDEMYRTGGEGLTEYWDDFDVDDVKKFIIRVKIDADEFNRENFEKCIVNKVTVYYKDVYEASDTATVCYGDSDIKELPETGASLVVSLSGLLSIAFGAVMKKRELS